MEIENILKEVSEKMAQICQHTREKFKTIQVHKITSDSLGMIKVNYYETATPIYQVARVSTMDTQTLLIDPFEKKMSTIIETAIKHNKKDFFVRQNKSGGILVSLPRLTEERRSKLVKELQKDAEHEKVTIRNKRSDIKKEFKTLQKGGTSEDEVKKGEEALQKITDQYIQEIDKMSKEKEKALMQV